MWYMLSTNIWDVILYNTHIWDVMWYMLYMFVSSHPSYNPPRFHDRENRRRQGKAMVGMKQDTWRIEVSGSV